MRRSLTVSLALLASLAGCANPQVEERLNEAAAAYREVSEDPQVLRIAPKDVIRAS